MNEKSTRLRANNDGKFREVYLPNNLQLEQFLQEHQPQFNYQIDKFRHILSLVYEIRRNKDIRKQGSYTPISAQMLSNNGVHDYTQYVKYLLDNNILETDNTYHRKVKCKGYRYKDDYQTPVKVEHIIKPTLLKAIAKAKAKYEDNTLQHAMAEKYDYLKRHFNENLNIDVMAAKKYLSEQLEADKAKRVLNANERYNWIFHSN